MEPQVRITARVPAELRAQADRVAAATGRSRAGVVRDALRAYLARELACLEAVEEGVRQMEAGDVVPHAAVVAQLRGRRLPPPVAPE